MNWTRVGIVGLVGLCVWAAWPKSNGAAPRPVMIKAALNQTADPIVILGDSIVEWAPLPSKICNRPVVNAGIGGSTTSSGLDAMLVKAIGSKKAAMIVVSLGINDAMQASRPAAEYRTNYLSMLARLATVAPRLAVLTVTPIEPGASASGQTQNQRIAAYNAVLPDIASTAKAQFIAVPQLPSPATRDGVHLNDAGYAAWIDALTRGIEATCKPS